jgi:hypothetical protein
MLPNFKEKVIFMNAAKKKVITYNQCLWKINCPLSQFTGNYSLCIIKVDWTHVHQSDKTQLIVANNTQQIPLTVRVITFFFAALCQLRRLFKL